MTGNAKTHLVEMRFSGHRKMVEFALIGNDHEQRCRIRLTWSDENVEYWLRFQADRWKFQTKVEIPKEIVDEAATFDRLIKLFNQGTANS